MKHFYKEYHRWLSQPTLISNLRDELESISDNEVAIEDRFYSELAFGTAGIRGLLGAGTNRLNIYTISKISEGLARVVVEEKGKDLGVVIGYDTRHCSKEFAELTSEILANHGIKVYLFNDNIPTPVLSYAVRKLNAISGVMITASHNPKEYNGYKVYWRDGTQITDEIANKISKSINEVKDIFAIDKVEFSNALESGIVEYIGEELIDEYIDKVVNLKLNDDVDKEISVVYSPLNGAGNKLVREVLKRRDFNNLHIVSEQELPDPDFTTVGYPNPEEVSSFKYAIKLGNECDAELLIATDPDADRVGAVVKHAGEYKFISGNAMGALLVNYVLSQMYKDNRLQGNSKIITTIATGVLAHKIAKEYNVEVVKVHVGFKNIYSIVNKWSKEDGQFILGYEESLGYGIGDKLARDKDAVSASMMLVEMAAFYKKQGKTLIEVYNELQDKYGYRSEKTLSIKIDGVEGQAKISKIVNSFRDNPLMFIGKGRLTNKIDYLNDETELDKLNVLKYEYDNGSWFAIRPSGTEPKLKVYVHTSAESEWESEENLSLMTESIMNRINEASGTKNC